MGGLTPVHWKRFEKFLISAGCQFVREKGDHRIYSKSGLPRPIVVPRDTQLPVFVMRNNLRLLGVTVEEYMDALRRL